MDAHEHYARAEWVGADLDASANVGVRERSDVEAAAGPGAVLRWGSDAYDQVATLLERPRAPDLVAPPWLTWLTIHSDDLAASVGVATPQFPEVVIADVVDILTAVALRRHGQTAVRRALSRPQRAPENISAF